MTPARARLLAVKIQALGSLARAASESRGDPEALRFLTGAVAALERFDSDPAGFRAWLAVEVRRLDSGEQPN